MSILGRNESVSIFFVQEQQQKQIIQSIKYPSRIHRSMLICTQLMAILQLCQDNIHKIHCWHHLHGIFNQAFIKWKMRFKPDEISLVCQSDYGTPVCFKNFHPYCICYSYFGKLLHDYMIWSSFLWALKQLVWKHQL